MRTFTFILTLLFSVMLSSSLSSQSVEELIQEGDKYNTEFNHKKSLETYQKADKLSPANWEVLWRMSRAIVDIANKMPEETDEQKEAKFDKYKKSFVYAD
ncbi:MAG TPA: hypothetical protein VIZ21_06840, partial [Ignavibacteriaceae bacterium]